MAIQSQRRSGNLEDRKEACKTYLEQTKLLVTLASAFVFAPAVVNDLSSFSLQALLWMEGCFVFSVISAYVVMGTITGSQNDGTYNVDRLATRVFSLIQFFAYLAGLIIFILNLSQVKAGEKVSKQPQSKTSAATPINSTRQRQLPAVIKHSTHGKKDSS